MYLGDFGMVTKYKTEDVKPDKKCANNGTLNYIALDGHLGSNFCFFFYCSNFLLHFLCFIKIVFTL